MKKLIYLFIVSLFSVAAMGQTNFSGTWKLNNSKSTLGEEFSMAPKDIIIVQDGNSFNVERHSTFQDRDITTKDKLTLDGKECENPGWRDSIKKSVAEWSSDKKSINVVTKIPFGDSDEMKVVDVYKLDGENLVLKTDASSSRGDMSETYVFDKQ
ncbi:MAG: hypothetical protein HQ522_06795 [Bacteroidetes bacterium]|nr:hypothetical protein [Bacteroidota bacterium]